MRLLPLRRASAAALAAGLALAVTGCFNPFAPRIAPVRGVSSPPPVPNSASQVVELFTWCWNHRAYQEYSEIFTDDFFFEYVERDSAGNLRGQLLDRENELRTALNLFVEGSATSPPAESITLDITRPLIEFPDSRPGKIHPWHKEITTQVVLRIDVGEQEFAVEGRARFFLVRGDSARIPASLQSRFRADSTRWWIERWEDETGGGETGATGRVPVRHAALAGYPALRNTATGDPLALSWARLKLAFLGRRP